MEQRKFLVWVQYLVYVIQDYNMDNKVLYMRDLLRKVLILDHELYQNRLKFYNQKDAINKNNYIRYQCLI